MRIRTTSGLFSRLALAGAVLCTLPSAALAWDEDRIQNELQPYFGVWAGMYMIDTKDLKDLGAAGTKELSSKHFGTVLPALGGSLGVAYGRLHAGLNGGYQLLSGKAYPYNTYQRIGSTDYPIRTSSYYYRYQVIPVDANLDVALLPNETPVNLLVGGSVGIGFVGMQLPFANLVSYPDTAHITLTSYRNDWNWSNFLLATVYTGARINLARRLNLEGQIGYRVLKSDEVEIAHKAEYVRTNEMTFVDSTGVQSGGNTGHAPIDLSNFYLRVDARWTFASDAERDEAKSAERARRIHEILAMTPARLQQVALSSN